MALFIKQVLPRFCKPVNPPPSTFAPVLRMPSSSVFLSGEFRKPLCIKSGPYPDEWPLDRAGPPAIVMDDLEGSIGTKAKPFPVESKPKPEGQNPSTSTSKRICTQTHSQQIYQTKIDKQIKSNNKNIWGKKPR